MTAFGNINFVEFLCTSRIRRLSTRFNTIKNYGMVQFCIFMTLVLLFQTFIGIFHLAFSIRGDGTFGD